MKAPDIKHFSAAVFVVYEKKVLMIFHRKLKRWLPPGGHLENNELPQDCAVREVLEETGINTILLNSKNTKFTKGIRPLTQPHHMQLETIEENGKTHYHIDFVFYGYTKSPKVTINLQEATKYQWMNVSDLQQIDEKEIIDSAQDAILIVNKYLSSLKKL